ncbi:hypothetical protein NB724_001346 [Pantoea ananatis]|uniref:hypothetical protein n=1 Tax=Pantoea ananas TaxID=553 RepID=UPI0021F7D6CE|nr:hypothetical protein [Pantoea ananatis]MCW0316195.1 hypothetical protein [Pantoea ananatis]MCW0334335.1 hypothetical protein [Pantoea ananatis]MCW0382696.1 hypothetical protein [Pantoea ananatis]MCW0407360.1 hypothetical protein [Pantoea ananatis]MCW0427352.1 hypothetical protein [Pantoea ananatis]
MKFVDYTVLITFDLSYANSSDYDSVNKFLTEKGFEQLSHKGNALPSNTYLGEDNHLIGKFDSVQEGAEKLKNNIYNSIKRNMNGSGLQSVVFVMVSPKAETSYSCSKPIDH